MRLITSLTEVFIIILTAIAERIDKLQASNIIGIGTFVNK